MITKNKTIKSISSLLIISIILPSVLLSIPQKGYAIWGVGDAVFDATNAEINSDIAVSVGSTAVSTGTIAESMAVNTYSTGVNTAYTIKNWVEYIGKELLKVVAKRILAQMTQATINWINSDFHGSPLFLENPDSFFKDIVKSELKNVVNMFGYDSLLYPFGRQFALNTINSYRSQLADNAGYTLSNVMNETEQYNYRNNFNYGGWNGFLTNTQYPQNNYLGFQMLATEELARRIQGITQNAGQKVQTALQQGMGFLSPQTCPSNPDYNNGTNEFRKPSFQYDAPFECSGAMSRDPAEMAAYSQCEREWEAGKEASQREWAEKNTCPGGLVNTTPGSVAANQIFNALDTPRLSTALDGALGNSVAAIFDALISHFLDKGLNTLSNVVSPEPEADNWSYDGNTLTGSSYNAGTGTTTGNAGTTEALNIPQNVSLRVGETTSTPISGGSGNYSIQIRPNASKATAMIYVSGSSGNKLSITGVAPGTTSVTVQDSYNPDQTVTVTITVTAIGGLKVTPANISTDIEGEVIAKISGGTGEYSIKIGAGADTSTAIATLSGANLIVIGVNNGATSVIIKDSSTPAKEVRVNIRVGPDVLIFDQSNISIRIGGETSVSISNGKPPYRITSEKKKSVTDAKINLNTLNITGLTAGINIINIEDSPTNANGPLSPKKGKVRVEVLPDLTITPSISIKVNGKADLSISNGAPSYTIKTNSNPDVVKTEIHLNHLIVTGLKAGTSRVTIEDNSSPEHQTTFVDITVTENLYSW